LPVLSDITCEISGRQSAGQGTERYSLTRVDARDLHSDEGDVQQIDVASLMPRIVSRGSQCDGDAAAMPYP
jgi:type VI secretion system protein ImpJ